MGRRYEKRVVVVAVLIVLVVAIMITLEAVRSAMTVGSVAWRSDSVAIDFTHDESMALASIFVAAVGAPILALLVIDFLARSPQVTVGRSARRVGLAAATVIGLVVPGAVYLTDDRTPDAASVAVDLVGRGGDVGAALGDLTYVPTGPGGQPELVDPVQVVYRVDGLRCTIVLIDPLDVTDDRLRLSPWCTGA
ncbi:MAG: hypothetical protein ACK5RL_21455 [Acidimicrobiales bacterium]